MVSDLVKFSLCIVALIALLAQAHSDNEEFESRTVSHVATVDYPEEDNQTVHLLIWKKETPASIKLNISNMSTSVSDANADMTNVRFFVDAPSIEFSIRQTDGIPLTKSIEHEGTWINYTSEDGWNGTFNITHPGTDRWQVTLFHAYENGKEFLFNGTINETFVDGNFIHGCLKVKPLV